MNEKLTFFHSMFLDDLLKILARRFPHSPKVAQGGISKTKAELTHRAIKNYYKTEAFSEAFDCGQT